MSLMAAAAIASGVIGLGKTAYGAYQVHKGSQMAKKERPEYNIPQEIEDLDKLPALYRNYLTELESGGKLPGQDEAERQLRQSTAGGVRATTERARSSTEALGAATDLYGKELEQIQRLELESIRERARRKVQAMRDYTRTSMGTAQTQAQYSDQAFRLNEMEPYMQDMVEAQERRRAGFSMIGSGMNNMGSAAMMYSQFGGGGQNPTGMPGGGGQPQDVSGYNEFNPRGVAPYNEQYDPYKSFYNQYGWNQ